MCFIFPRGVVIALYAATACLSSWCSFNHTAAVVVVVFVVVSLPWTMVLGTSIADVNCMFIRSFTRFRKCAVAVVTYTAGMWSELWSSCCRGNCLLLTITAAWYPRADISFTCTCVLHLRESGNTTLPPPPRRDSTSVLLRAVQVGFDLNSTEALVMLADNIVWPDSALHRNGNGSGTIASWHDADGPHN